MTPEESIKFQRDESNGELKSTPLITAYFEVEKRKGCTYSERWCFRRKYIFCFERHIFEGNTYSQTEIHILERNGSRNFDDKALLWGPLRGPLDEKESWWKTSSHIWMENICIKNETKIVDFTYSHRRGGNLQHCKGEKQKRHFIYFIISLNFLADSLRDQKDSSKNLNVGQKSCLQTLQRHNKYVSSCKSLPSIVLSLKEQITPYSPGRQSTSTLIFLLFSD